GGKSQWRYRRVNATEWIELQRPTVLDDLARGGLDMNELNRQLASHCIEQALFARQVVTSAQRISGKTLLEQAEQEHSRFLLQLRDALSRLIHNNGSAADVAELNQKAKKRPSLRLI